MTEGILGNRIRRFQNPVREFKPEPFALGFIPVRCGVNFTLALGG